MTNLIYNQYFKNKNIEKFIVPNNQIIYPDLGIYFFIYFFIFDNNKIINYNKSHFFNNPIDKIYIPSKIINL